MTATSAMNLGMLATDSRIAAVAAAAVARGDRIVLTAEVPAGMAPDARAVTADALLDPSACDAVLVGADGWSDGRAEAVRLLVQAGRPILASQPLDLSMLWAWELEMIRRDAGGPLVPLLPERLHPFVARLRTLLESSLGGGGPLGEVESIVLERQLADRDRERVLRALARDADLVRALAGDPARLSALGADDAAGWQSLVVGFSGPTSVPVRWQVASGDDHGLRLAVHFSGGMVSLRIPDDWSRPWVWTEPGLPDEQLGYEPASMMLELLASKLQPRPTDEPDPEALPAATWSDAARAIELADTVPRSLAKGRAIDLHQEEFSELGTFRGTMASLGCGIILAALVLVVVAALVGGLAHEFGWGFGGWLAGTWPIVALAALGGFLLLQLLPLLIGGGSPAGPAIVAARDSPDREKLPGDDRPEAEPADEASSFDDRGDRDD
jgi:predicted dehydrogenase